MKFRIVEYTHCVNDLGRENGRARIEYVIEKKLIGLVGKKFLTLK